MAATPPLHFVLPESAELVSGGNLYNAALLASLEKRHQVQWRRISEFCQSTPGPGTYLLDSLNLSELYEMRLARAVGRNLVLLVHHLPSLEPGLLESDASRATEHAALPMFDAFVCTSEFTASYLRSRAWAQPSITIEPAIPIPTLGARRSRQSASALMSCNLIRRKGVLEFLQALATATEAADSYQLTIVGRHDLEANYSAECARLLNGSKTLQTRVTLAGESPKSEMGKWYQNSNLFVSASRMETFGISLQEARYNGLPILAVRGGNSANHVTPGVTGELCENPTELAAEFLRWARDGTRLSSYLDQAEALRPTDGGTWEGAADRLAGQMAKWFPCQ